MAWLWLLAPNSSANATHDAINAAPSGMSWLSTVQDWAAEGAQGNGLVIALVLAAVSAAIGIAVAIDWRPRQFLVLAIVLNLLYWVLGQGFGGIFEGGATDPNAGLLFVLLALALYPLTPPENPDEPGSGRAQASPRGRSRRLRCSPAVPKLTSRCRCRRRRCPPSPLGRRHGLGRLANAASGTGGSANAAMPRAARRGQP